MKYHPPKVSTLLFLIAAGLILGLLYVEAGGTASEYGW